MTYRWFVLNTNQHCTFLLEDICCFYRMISCLRFFAVMR